MSILPESNNEENSTKESQIPFKMKLGNVRNHTAEALQDGILEVDADLPSLCSQIAPCSHEARLVRDWTVDDVCQFVASIEICAPYSEVRTLLLHLLITLKAVSYV